MRTDRLPTLRNLLTRVSARHPNLVEVFEFYYSLLEVCYAATPDDLSPWIGSPGDSTRLDLRALEIGRLPHTGETYNKILELASDSHRREIGSELALKWALKPSFMALREGRSFPLPNIEENRIRCFLCGGTPAFAELPLEGGRRVFCGFCGSGWPVEETVCLACGDRDRAHKGFFVGDDGGRFGYRAETCEVCRTYLKTAHRKIQKEIVEDVDVEDLITLPLDLLADSRGFRSLSRRGTCPDGVI